MERALESLYPVNKYQTPITEELKESLHREVWLELTEYIDSVPFIRNLIAPEKIRGFAKDQAIENTYYKDGRIEVNLTKPHILEDMDYFRERALFFQKNGRYTNLRPNPNPRSDYAEFWKEELRRWKYGLVRESDGEWIPGQLYFYWNYSPIWLTESTVRAGGEKSKGERFRKFPKPWLGDYLFYHYMEQGRIRGMHGKLLKTRGVGFEQPDSELVLSDKGWTCVGDIKIGDNLISRKGELTKVLEVCPQGIKDVYEVEFSDGRKVECGLNHLWAFNYKGKLKTFKTSELLERKLSNYIDSKKFTKYYYTLPKIEPIKYSEKSQYIKPYLLGFLIGDGNLNHSEIRFSTADEEILNFIKADLGDSHTIVKHNTPYSYGIISKQKGLNNVKREINKLQLNCKAGDKHIPSNYLKGSYEQRMELLRGLMDSDGCISNNGSISFVTTSFKLKEDFTELVRSLGIKCTISTTDLHTRSNTFNKNVIFRIGLSTTLDIFKLSRKKERLLNKKKCNDNVYLKSITSLNKKENSTCFLVDNVEHLYLTRDFVPTHNSFKMGSISPCNMFTLPGTGNPNFHLASEKTFLSGDKGIWGKVLDTLDWVQEHTPLSSMRLVDDLKNMTVQLGYKDIQGVRKGLLSTVFGISLRDNPEKARGIRGPLIHYEEDGLFPNLEKAWNVNRKAVEDGSVSFGYMLAGGTGGTEGGSFEGSEKLFYHPSAYNIYGVPNVYDKNATGDSQCGFFWGAYLNRNECYDEETGEPDVIKSIVEVLKDRFIVKYNSTDPNAITQKKAEEPITPQEAVMRTEGTVFSIADLKDYLESVMVKRDNFLAEHYTGELIRNVHGKVEFKPNASLHPIRSYGKDTIREGCVEIFQMPKTNAEGEIVRGRYLFGIDPIDADSGTSLFSIVGMDTFTDQIVCEYSGRPRLAAEAYEKALRLIEFYNGEANYEQNLKGLFSYFDQRNALHRLCDTPQILRDMEYIKQVGAYGNKSKGTLANPKINSWARILQAEWQKTPIPGDDTGALNMHKLRSIPYLEECISWNSDGNFDRVSAYGMLFILREDRYKRIKTASQNQNASKNNLANDKFFEKNYNKAIDMKKNHLNMGTIF